MSSRSSFESVAAPVTPSRPRRGPAGEENLENAGQIVRTDYARKTSPRTASLRKVMSAYKSDFLNVLAERGFIHQVSEPEALDAAAKAGSISGYIGFDCTAASLHVGSLLPIMMLYWMQQTGHRPIALMGGGTTRVGDPS